MKKRLIAIVFVLIAAFGVLCYGSRYRRQKTPAVSVVMLTYQRAEMLPQAIESILSQTFSDFEFIIINDGSSDGTENILVKYKNNIKTIMILVFAIIAMTATGELLFPVTGRHLWRVENIL